MIIKEFYKTRADGVNLFRTYSDEGKQIVKDEKVKALFDLYGVNYNEGK